MESAMAAADDGEENSSEAERRINALAQRHLDERQMSSTRWESELNGLRDTQRREFRAWVMTVHEGMETGQRIPRRYIILIIHERYTVQCSC